MHRTIEVMTSCSTFPEVRCTSGARIVRMKSGNKGLVVRSRGHSAMMIPPTRGGLAHAHLATGRLAETARLLAWRRGRWSGPMDRVGRPDRRRREGRISTRYRRASRRRAAKDCEVAHGGRRRPRAYRPPDLVSDQPERIRGGRLRHWCGLARDDRAKFPALDAALHRRPGRCPRQGRDRSHRVCPNYIGGKRDCWKFPPACRRKLIWKRYGFFE